MRQLSFRYGGAPEKRAGRTTGRPRKGGSGKTSSRKGQRRGPIGWWIRRLPRLAPPALGVALCLAAGIWFADPERRAQVGDPMWDAFVGATASQGLTIERVFSTGRRETPADAIIAALGTEIGSPILSFDPDDARERLEQIVWVESATVERRLPSTIHVRISERRPFALWQRNNELVVIDRTGAVIGAEPVARYAFLPIIVGPGAPGEAPALLDAMASDPVLRERMVAAIWVSGRRWNLRFDTGLEAKLPEGDVPGAWNRLAEMIQSRRLLEQPVMLVDLRLTDRTILRLKPPTPPSADAT